MDCRRMEQFISPYLDGELTPTETAGVGSHLSVCGTCQREYEAMLGISAACRQIREIILPAPAGFKDAVMQHMSDIEKTAPPVSYTAWFSRRWKQAAGAAAAVVLLLGAASIHTVPVAQLADKIPALIQTDSNSTVAINPVNDATSTQPGVVTSAPAAAHPVPATNNSSTTQIAAVAAPSSVRSAPVFMNTERYATTTLLQVRVTDASAALEQAVKLAAAVQASTQNLGQQVNANGSYTVLKITVAKSAASSLLTDLSNLGTVSGQDVNKKDISASYADTLYQYQNLVTERATLQDDSQKAGLDQRIAALVAELQNWEQIAEQETIVLWLEK